jgi:hypothetical protein
VVEREFLLLDVVAELHDRGYQYLRIAPGLSPSGMSWRCEVASVVEFRSDHGALLQSGCTQRLQFDSNRLFRGAVTIDPKASVATVATQLVADFPKIASACLGTDRAYVRWFSEMLALIRPDALPFAYADYRVSDIGLATVGRKLLVPMPPLPMLES